MEGKSSDWLRGPSGPTVCRCCFAEGCYKDISTEYFWMGKREVYAEMLTETLDLTIAYAQSSGPNSNSRLICEPCISRLRDASEFKRQVQECEKMFLQYLDPGREGVTDLEAIPETLTLEKDVKLENVKQEKGQSDDDFDDRAAFEDDDDDDLDDQPLTRLASKVPKKESVDLLDLLDNAKVAEKRKSTAKTRATPAKKAKTKKESPKATASKTKPEKKKKELVGESVEAAQRNARIILRYSTAYPFRFNMATMKLQCCFCIQLFEEPSLFRTHMDTEHADIDKSKTVAPSSRSNTRVDITNLRCKGCMANFDTIDRLATHLNQVHKLDVNVNYHHGLVPIKLEKNRFKCVICSKLFTGLKQLWRHSGGHFFRYICDACGKHYETPIGLSLHVKYNHSGNDKPICKHCKQSFPTKQARNDHVKTTKACQPTVCHICSERFLHWQQKEEHMVSVHGKERRVFPCTECDKVFTQRTVLYVHFRTTHTDDNKCQYCEKQFPTMPRLREHTARHHTGERAFACSLCDMTFIDGQSLKRHLVTHDDSKKHACSLCDRLYARKYRLTLHMAKHHPDASNK